MFEGFSQETLDFMWGIRFNNEKTWFEAHKQDYLDHLYRPMQALCRQLYASLEGECAKRGMVGRVCRIYRDARRLHGNGPYKDHLWLTLERPSEDRFATRPVFWFELTPDGWSYGLGYYSARPVTMAKLRARMERDPKAILRMQTKLDKRGEFLLDGPSYKKEKTAPHPKLTSWYNKKSFSFIHEEGLTEELFSPALAERLTEAYRFLLPYYDFLDSLEGDPAPDGYEK